MQSTVDGRSTCEFCVELASPNNSTFASIYQGSPSHRRIYEDDKFVVLPAIGQIFPYWLLVLPKAHVERMAQLDPSELSSLRRLIGQICSILSSHGVPVLFEHGASSASSSGCGIYHAHLHMVPLPRTLKPTEILPELQHQETDVASTLSSLTHWNEYLLYAEWGGPVTVAKPQAFDVPVPSQFFRRQLASLLHAEKPWDWRAYGPEQDLLEALDHVGPALGATV